MKPKDWKRRASLSLHHSQAQFFIYATKSLNYEENNINQQFKRNISMEGIVYHLKCNAPDFEQHRGYHDGKVAMEIAKSDFFSLQSQFEARGFNVKTFFRSNPMRGRIQVEIDGFYYYVELFKAKDL